MGETWRGTKREFRWFGIHKVISAALLLILLGILWSALSGSSKSGTAAGTHPPSTPGAVAAADQKAADALVLTSTLVSRTQGKYRYDFTLRNTGAAPFSGTVVITLTSQDGRFTDDELALAERALRPGATDTGSIAINRGTPDVAGASGIATYRYTVTAGSDHFTYPAALVTTHHQY